MYEVRLYNNVGGGSKVYVVKEYKLRSGFLVLQHQCDPNIRTIIPSHNFMAADVKRVDERKEGDGVK